MTQYEQFQRWVDELIQEAHLNGQVLMSMGDFLRLDLTSPAHDLAVAPPGAPQPRCECGGARALTTHSTWCPMYGREAA